MTCIFTPEDTNFYTNSISTFVNEVKYKKINNL